MKPKNKSSRTPENPSFEEEKMLQHLRKNPIMAEQLQSIMAQFEQEVAQGMDAHQAELKAVMAVQKFGESMMRQWAETAQETSIQKAFQDDSTLQKHSKKNSSGKPPSAP